MSSCVNWFGLEEEYTIGSAEVSGKDVFITEEAVRFDAPRVTIHETLRDAAMQICGLVEDDLEYDEEREYFEKFLKKITKKYED